MYRKSGSQLVTQLVCLKLAIWSVRVTSDVKAQLLQLLILVSLPTRLQGHLLSVLL